MNETEKLDSNWISEFEDIDTSYNKFYKETVDFVCVTFVYIDKDNQIKHVNKEKIILRPKNVLPYNILMDLITTYKERFSYKFDFLMKYNINTEPYEVKSLLKDQNHERYIQETSKIDNVNFENTISMFQDLNELILFFRDNLKKNNQNNKTIKIHSLKNHIINKKSKNKTLKSMSIVQNLNIK